MAFKIGNSKGTTDLNNLKKYFNYYLKKENIFNENEWVKKSSSLPIYEQKVIAKILIFCACNTVPSTDKPYLLKSVKRFKLYARI